MEQKLLDYAAILRPVLELVVTLAVPILAAKLYGWLGIKAEKDQTEIEKMLRDALHASAQNALVYALQKHGLSFNDLSSKNALGTILGTAQEYVREKNPDALAKLNVDGSGLRDILMSKLPTSR